MPTVTTLQGFFVVAGLVLFVFSLFSGPIEGKVTKLPGLDATGRMVLRVLGTILFVAGLVLYASPPLTLGLH